MDAGQALAKHISGITVGADDTGSIKYKENSNFREMTGSAGMVPRARIELATPAFSGRRSTTELLRQVVH